MIARALGPEGAIAILAAMASLILLAWASYRRGPTGKAPALLAWLAIGMLTMWNLDRVTILILGLDRKVVGLVGPVAAIVWSTSWLWAGCHHHVAKQPRPASNH